MQEYRNYLNVHDGIMSKFDEVKFSRKSQAYGRLYGRFLPKARESRILDIGCGTGLFLYYLKCCSYTNYYGIDVSKENIEFVRKNITNRCEYADMFEYLRNKEGSFDVIVMNEVLEHISKEKVIPFFELVYKSLSINGVFLVLVPNMENPATVYTRWHDFTHKTGFTQNSLKMVFRLGGFKNITVYPTTRFKRFSLVRRIILSVPYLLTKLYFVVVFQYPLKGILFSKRIIAVAKK
jgi:2-polyprenyl-3-methyl-5-hydroxy-6-metoxy-1,4-benzoquinol methylase